MSDSWEFENKINEKCFSNLYLGKNVFKTHKKMCFHQNDSRWRFHRSSTISFKCVFIIKENLLISMEKREHNASGCENVNLEITL